MTRWGSLLPIKGRINHFDIWNEYNGRPDTSKNEPALYAEMLKRAYIAIKEVNHNAFIVGCSTSGADLAWIDGILQAGGLTYMDAVSIHPYSTQTSPENGGFVKSINDTHKLIQKYGEDKPVWVTEIGWPSTTVTEWHAAVYAVRTMALFLANNPNDKMFWYDLQNDGVSENNEHNFGLVRCWENEIVPYAAKLPYLAYATAARQLQDAQPVADLSEYGDKLLQFKRDEATFYVAWHQSAASKEFEFEIEAKKVKITDIYGNESVADVENGKLSLILKREPVFIEVISSNSEADVKTDEPTGINSAVTIETPPNILPIALGVSLILVLAALFVFIKKHKQ